MKRFLILIGALAGTPDAGYLPAGAQTGRIRGAGL